MSLLQRIMFPALWVKNLLKCTILFRFINNRLERPYICVETRDKELAKLCTCKHKTRHAIYQTTTSSLSPRTISSSKEKREADKSPIATTVAALLIGYFSGILSAVGWCYIFARKSTVIFMA